VSLHCLREDSREEEEHIATTCSEYRQRAGSSPAPDKNRVPRRLRNRPAGWPIWQRQ